MFTATTVINNDREDNAGLLKRRQSQGEERCQVPFFFQSQGKEEIENIRYAIKKSRPYGSQKWVSRAVAKFGLESTPRDRGRPKKGT
jgi:hypothetical protein